MNRQELVTVLLKTEKSHEEVNVLVDKYFDLLLKEGEDITDIEIPDTEPEHVLTIIESHIRIYDLINGLKVIFN
jgi:hypothetical protein